MMVSQKHLKAIQLNSFRHATHYETWVSYFNHYFPTRHNAWCSRGIHDIRRQKILKKYIISYFFYAIECRVEQIARLMKSQSVKFTYKINKVQISYPLRLVERHRGRYCRQNKHASRILIVLVERPQDYGENLE